MYKEKDESKYDNLINFLQLVWIITFFILNFLFFIGSFIFNKYAGGKSLILMMKLSPIFLLFEIWLVTYIKRIDKKIIIVTLILSSIIFVFCVVWIVIDPYVFFIFIISLIISLFAIALCFYKFWLIKKSRKSK